MNKFQETLFYSFKMTGIPNPKYSGSAHIINFGIIIYCAIIAFLDHKDGVYMDALTPPSVLKYFNKK